MIVQILADTVVVTDRKSAVGIETAIMLAAGIGGLSMVLYLLFKTFGGAAKAIDRRTGPVTRTVSVKNTAPPVAARKQATPPPQPASVDAPPKPKRDSSPLQEMWPAELRSAFATRSLEFMPRFADLFVPAGSTEVVRYPGLELRFNRTTGFPGPMQDEGAEVTFRAHGTCTLSRSELTSARGSADEVVTIFEGDCVVTTTTTRLIGVCPVGESVLGKLGGPFLMFWSLPYRFVVAADGLPESLVARTGGGHTGTLTLAGIDILDATEAVTLADLIECSQPPTGPAAGS